MARKIASIDEATKAFTPEVVAANSGTTAQTFAGGADTRITGAAQKSANLGDLASAATARTNLGLGTAATTDATAYATAAQGELADATTVQQVTLTAPLAYTLPVSVPAGIVHRVTFTQNGTGGHTVTFDGQPVTVDLTAGASTPVEVWPGRVVRYPSVAATATLPPATGTDDTANINATLAACAGKRVTGAPGAAYRISAPLVIQSGTTLDLTGCTVTMTAPEQNMIRNEHYATGDRDTNIAIVGGTWIRGNHGGTGNNQHSIFLRRIDGVRVEGAFISSQAGKYAVALGDVTVATVTDVRFATFSDGMHLTGPASDVLIEGLSGVTGDDMVGITTTDYSTFDDVHGSIRRVTVRNIAANSPGRAVLVSGSASGAGDGFTVADVDIDTVNQASSAGVGVYIDAPNATTAAEIIDNVRITRASVGGTGPVVQLRAGVMGRVTVEDSTASGAGALVLYSPPGTMATSTVDTLTVRRARAAGTAALVHVALTNCNIKRLVVDACTNLTGTAPLLNISNGVVTELDCIDTTYTGAGRVLTIENAAVVTRATFERLSATIANVVTLAQVATAATLTDLTFSNCTIGAVNTNSGVLLYTQTGSSCLVLRVIGGVLSGIKGVARVAMTATVLDVIIAGVRMAGCNRIVDITTGAAGARLTYSSVLAGSFVNPPIYIAAGVAEVRGAGWAPHATNSVTKAGGTITCEARDFPLDVSLVTPSVMGAARNTNAALACGTGPVISNGTAWKHVYTDAIYTP